MSNHDRRQVLKYAGLAVAAGGVLSTGTVAGDEGETDGPSAAAEGWSSLRGNAGNTGYVPNESGPDEPVAIAWEYDHDGPVAVVDGNAFLTVDGAIHALDADDGEPVGETDDVGAAGGPAIADETIYVGGDHLTTIDLGSGEVDWQADLEYEDSVPSPTVVDGRVVVVAGGTLHALDADDGDEAWQFEPDDGALIEQTVAAVDGAVFTTDGNVLYAHEVDDGSERWAENGGKFRKQVVVATDTTVSVQAGGVDEVAVYDTETGDRRWIGGGYVSGLATDDHLYTLVHGDIVGYDRETGDELWRPSVDASTYSAPVTDGETIYVGLSGSDRGTGVAAFDGETGDFEWIVETDAHPESLALADGTIYAGADGLLAIRADQDGEDTTDDEDDAEDDDETEDGEPFEGEEADDETEDADDGDESEDANDEGETADDDGEVDEGDETVEDDGDDEEETVDDGDDDDETADEGDDDGLGDDGGDTESDDEDSMPGFTTGAGVAGGALTLEWLRRKAGVTDELEE